VSGRVRKRFASDLADPQEKRIRATLQECQVSVAAQDAIVGKLRLAFRLIASDNEPVYPSAKVKRVLRTLGVQTKKVADLRAKLQAVGKVIGRQKLWGGNRTSFSVAEVFDTTKIKEKLPLSGTAGHVSSAVDALNRLEDDLRCARARIAGFSANARPGTPARDDVGFVLYVLALTLLSNGLPLTTTQVSTKDPRRNLFGRLARILHPDRPAAIDHDVLRRAIRSAKDPAFGLN
jgi:hypothetical protein